MKIAIIGYSGSGKSTLAKRLGELLNIQPLHLDSIGFTTNWKPVPQEEYYQHLRETLSHPDWIIEGNFLHHSLTRFEDCDILINLKVNRLVCLFSTIKRYFRYKKKPRSCRPVNCKEKYDFSFFIWVLFKSRSRRRLEVIKHLEGTYKSKLIILKTRKQIDRYIANFADKKTLDRP